MNTSTIQDEKHSNEISEYVNEHREFLSRVLRHGDTNARGYALALLANGGSEDDIAEVQQALESLKDSEE